MGGMAAALGATGAAVGLAEAADGGEEDLT